jgi:hypothetical protein
LPDLKITELTAGSPAQSTDQFPIARSATETRRLAISDITAFFTGSFAPLNHAARHQNGGPDEINVAGLNGLLADPQTPLPHAASHADGASDEINVTGLAGLLVTPQTPAAHKTTHQVGGSDVISVAGLTGLLATPQTPTLHAASHQDGGADEINVTGLSGTLADPQTASAHAASHQDAGADEIVVTGLSGQLADAQKIAVRKNTGANIGTRPRLNLIEGSNVTLTISDDGVDNEVDVMITSTAAGGGGGTVTHTLGPLTANQLVIGNAADDIKALGDAGTSVQVLHGNAAGAPTFGAVSLTADVSGDLPYANLTPSTAASKLLGRGDSGAGDWQEVSLGTNLAMSGTTLNATGGGGSGDVVGPAASTDGEVALYSGITGKLLKRSNALTGIGRVAAGVLSATELSGDVATSGSNAVVIANDAVTFAKMQNISAASRLLGRGSAGGAGDPQEILLGTNLSMSGITLNATAGGASSDVVVALASDIAHTTNSTTLENITGFVVPTTSSPTEIWRIDVMMVMNVNASGGTAADFKFGWAVSGGQTGIWASQIEREVGINVSVVLAPTLASTLAFGGNGTLAQSVIQFTAMMASNGVAGTVQLQFAQNGLQAGSIVTAKRLSSFLARKVAI